MNSTINATAGAGVVTDESGEQGVSDLVLVAKASGQKPQLFEVDPGRIYLEAGVRLPVTSATGRWGLTGLEQDKIEWPGKDDGPARRMWKAILDIGHKGRIEVPEHARDLMVKHEGFPMIKILIAEDPKVEDSWAACVAKYNKIGLRNASRIADPNARGQAARVAGICFADPLADRKEWMVVSLPFHKHKGFFFVMTMERLKSKRIRFRVTKINVEQTEFGYRVSANKHFEGEYDNVHQINNLTDERLSELSFRYLASQLDA